MRKLAIFDLDGTLLNTIEDLGAAVNHALQLNGYPTHSPASYPMFVGNGARKLVERALPDDKRTDEIISTILKDFTAFYNSHNTDLSKPYNGVTNLLKELQTLGVKIAVASNKYQSAVSNLVKYFFPNIDFIAVEGQKEGVPVKPDPSIVFSILAKAEICKSDTIYIGDSGVDMETARRACIDSIGVTWGFRSKSELEEACADYIVATTDDILTIIKNDCSLNIIAQNNTL